MTLTLVQDPTNRPWSFSLHGTIQRRSPPKLYASIPFAYLLAQQCFVGACYVHICEKLTHSWVWESLRGLLVAAFSALTYSLVPTLHSCRVMIMMSLPKGFHSPLVQPWRESYCMRARLTACFDGLDSFSVAFRRKTILLSLAQLESH